MYDSHKFMHYIDCAELTVSWALVPCSDVCSYRQMFFVAFVSLTEHRIFLSMCTQKARRAGGSLNSLSGSMPVFFCIQFARDGLTARGREFCHACVAAIDPH